MRTTRKAPKRPLDHEPEAVIYARGNAGLTQQQLADQCGVSKSLICEIENGRRNATPAMLIRLADALNCPKVVLERKREPETTPAAPRPVSALRHEERADEQGLPELLQANVTPIRTGGA